mmetsp:Transcript_9416/g.21232  ORF Transcript_9416/g.21232 Transcript_9416/m.21232 type:complete len:149 (-) Transcript_9416:23-469(-)
MMSSSTSSARPGYIFLIYYTMFGATGFGVSMFLPELVGLVHTEWADHIQLYDVWYRCLGSLWLSMGAASVLALSHPLRFSPVYVCQLLYKSIWICTTCLPRFLQGNLNPMDGAAALLMTTFIAMDVMFLPWDYILNGVVTVAKSQKSE